MSSSPSLFSPSLSSPSSGVPSRLSSRSSPSLIFFFSFSSPFVSPPVSFPSASMSSSLAPSGAFASASSSSRVASSDVRRIRSTFSSELATVVFHSSSVSFAAVSTAALVSLVCVLGL